MEFNCTDNDISYNIKPTDIAMEQINIPGFSMNKDLMDITLVGKSRLEYGVQFNENVLHLAEHFASESDTHNYPDTSGTYLDRLEKPLLGQIWYNKTFKLMNVCVDIDPQTWSTLFSTGHINGNCGFAFDGEEIPLPISPNGEPFDEDECFWTVTPAYINSEIHTVNSYEISTVGRVVKAEMIDSSSKTIKCFAYYSIIGIRKYND